MVDFTYTKNQNYSIPLKHLFGLVPFLYIMESWMISAFMICTRVAAATSPHSS